MVSRTPGAGERDEGRGRAAAFARAAFRLWRGHLSRALRPKAALLDYVRAPSSFVATASDRDARGLVAAGLIALAVGTASRFALSAPAGRPAAVTAGFLTLAWAGVRLAILAVLGGSAIPGRRLVTAWAGSLVPYALALGPLTSGGAFLLSAWLAYGGVLGASGDRRHAARLTGWAYGGQAVTSLVVWLARNALLFVAWLST